MIPKWPGNSLADDFVKFYKQILQRMFRIKTDELIGVKFIRRFKALFLDLVDLHPAVRDRFRIKTPGDEPSLHLFPAAETEEKNTLDPEPLRQGLDPVALFPFTV